MNTSIVTVRQRGQLTIPDIIRTQYSWLSTDSVVSIQAEDGERIVIEPFIRGVKKKTDWKKLKKQLDRIRSYQGKRGNLSDFIAKDRHNH